MVATPLAPSDRYIHPEATRIYWVESISDIQSPTRAELDNGIDLTGEVADIQGWDLHSLVITRPMMGEGFESQRPGSLATSGSSLMFYADRAGADIRILLSRQATGHVVFLEGGDVPGHPMSVWPVTVAATPRQPRVEGEPARITAQFVVTSQPSQDVEVPA